MWSPWMQRSRSRRQTRHLFIAAISAGLLVATGCGDDNDEEEIAEADIGFSSSQISQVSTDHPIAVDMAVEVNAEASGDVEDVDVENSDYFEIEDIDGRLIVVRALEAGESNFDVVVDDGEDLVQDSFSLRAEDIDESYLRPTCFQRDLLEDVFEHPYEDPISFLTDQVYEVHHRFYNDDGDRLAGKRAGSYSVDPEGGVEFADEGGDKLEVITGPDEVDATVSSSAGDHAVSMPLVHDENVDGIRLFRLEEFESDNIDLSVTAPGEEATLDIDERSTYSFFPNRFYDDAALCEKEDDIHFRITSTDTGVCALRDDDDESVESIEISSFGLVTLQLKSTGECTVDIEYLGGHDGIELIERFNWTIE